MYTSVACLFVLCVYCVVLLHAEARGGSDLTVAVDLSLGYVFSLGTYQMDYDSCALVV